MTVVLWRNSVSDGTSSIHRHGHKSEQTYPYHSHITDVSFTFFSHVNAALACLSLVTETGLFWPSFLSGFTTPLNGASLPVRGRRGRAARVWKSRDCPTVSLSARLSVTASEHRTRQVHAGKTSSQDREKTLFSGVDQTHRACWECNVDYYALEYFYENWG